MLWHHSLWVEHVSIDNQLGLSNGSLKLMHLHVMTCLKGQDCVPLTMLNSQHRFQICFYGENGPLRGTHPPPKHTQRHTETHMDRLRPLTVALRNARAFKGTAHNFYAWKSACKVIFVYAELKYIKKMVGFFVILFVFHAKLKYFSLQQFCSLHTSVCKMCLDF